MNIFSGLFKIELKLLLKQPISMIFGVAAPILFLMMQAEIFKNGIEFQSQNVNMVDVALPMFALMSIAVLAVGNVGIGLAYSRVLKFLKRLRLTPTKKYHYIGANLLVQILVAIVTLIVMFILVSVVYSVKVFNHNLLLFFLILLLDFLMCYFIGLFLGSVFKDPKVSQTVAMIVYFAFVFLGGFTFPIEIMPRFMQIVAYIMPTTHAVKVLQFAWNGTNLFADFHLLVVAVTTLIFGALSFKAFKFQ